MIELFIAKADDTVSYSDGEDELDEEGGSSDEEIDLEEEEEPARKRRKA